MRLISPARTPSRSAFTFLEVIVALALCAILAGVMASVLTATLRAEQTATRVNEGYDLCERLLAAVHSGSPHTNIVADAGGAWQLTQQPAVTGDGTNQVGWVVWEVSLVERPSLRQRFATRAPRPDR